MQNRVPDDQPDRPLKSFLLEFAKQQLAVMVTPRLMQLRCLAIGEARRFPELGELLHRMGPAR